MSRKTVSLIVALVAGSALAGAAMAHPGGGGGVGGGFGGGIGASGGNFGGNAGGNGFGRGSGDAGSVSRDAGNSFGRSNGFNETRQASINGENRRTVSSTADPKVLDGNSKADTALTQELTRKGIALPAGGLKTACAGFKSLGQCVATLHVAHNLNIPGGFDALKTAVLAPHGSLGEAIMKLDPSADALGQSNKASHQADNDLKG